MAYDLFHSVNFYDTGNDYPTISYYSVVMLKYMTSMLLITKPQNQFMQLYFSAYFKKLYGKTMFC